MKSWDITGNQVVREQLYSYLLDTYNEADLRFDNWEKGKLASACLLYTSWLLIKKTRTFASPGFLHLGNVSFTFREMGTSNN